MYCKRAILPLLIGLAASSALGENWPEFRGPAGDGQTSAKVPVTFSESENVAWKRPLPGKAWSSPVVLGDQVWLSNADPEGHRLSVVCLAAQSGEVLKDLLLFEIAHPQYCIEYNSFASPTPVLDDRHIYVSFGAHGTACVDTRTFQVLWTRQDLECNHHRGPGSSPILVGDRLVIPFDGYDQQYVVALDKASGRTLWRTDRLIDYGTDDGDLKKAYCTPVLIEHQGRRQLIAPAAVATEALDPETGEVLWTVYHDGMNAAARPVYGVGLVFVTNGMGRLTAIRPEGTGDITREGIVWDSTKGVPKRPSLILSDDLLYMVSDSGVASCLQAATGEFLWSERVGGEYDASPLFAQDRIYCFSRDGRVPVFRASREFELLATNRLEDGFMASPAVWGDSLILRTRSAVYRIAK